LQKALAEGFDKIATGHYAQILGPGEELRGKEKPGSNSELFHLLRGVDEIKDQSYFLSGLDQFQLSKSIFPL
jgi:tRNA methyl transferase